MTVPRPLVAGNWKMNGSISMLREPRLLAAMLKDVKLACDVMVCPPAILLRRVRTVLKGSRIRLGGQDCHWEAAGAHTGDISAEMLKEAGRGNTSRTISILTRGLVVLQILVTCLLLIGGLLQVQSIIRQQTIDHGYDTSSILRFSAW